MRDILTPISPGELLDKLTILQIKSERMTDAAKLKNVEVERAMLRQVAEANIPATGEIPAQTADLLAVNTQLWNIEDDIRDCERNDDFGPKFIELARAVYVTNDKRAELKRRINTALGSKIVEEKSYAKY